MKVKDPWPEIAKDTIPELDAYLRRCICVDLTKKGETE
jgi:hypothetical protein